MRRAAAGSSFTETPMPHFAIAATATEDVTRTAIMKIGGTRYRYPAA
jgi:hypothetical protein